MNSPGWFVFLRAYLLGMACGWMGFEAAQAAGDRVAFTGLPAQRPRSNYTFIDAFPGLTFQQPLAITHPPGETNRLFIVEKTGRIIVITNLAMPTRSVFLALTTNLLTSSEQGVLGLAFHPRYAENGRFFVFRTMRTGPSGVLAAHDVLSEFRVSATDPNKADPASERRLFAQYDDAPNHNGGDLHFGPDGYLYVSLGDEGGGNDSYQNGQRIDRELFAGILRLDVDFRPGSLLPNRNETNPAEAWMITTNYAIPADNPFVGTTNFLGKAVDPKKVRTEFWAVGLRNPWRMSFDRVTGELWVGDVGQDRWEMVHVTGRGANHGWPFREGPVAGPRTGAPADFTNNAAHRYTPALYNYAHGTGNFQGNSVIGGRVYRGRRIPALDGAYIFADSVRGHVWSLRRQPSGPPQVERLTALNVGVAFGEDPRDGELLAAAINAGQIQRLTTTPSGDPTFPKTLAETGAFTDPARLTAHPAFDAYEVNLPFWSDFAVKQRWFSLPPRQTVSFSEDSPWLTPAGTVWMKHFELELTRGVPESRRRLETRFLVRTTNGVYGLTYRWTSPTTATLVAEAGEDESIPIRDGDVLRNQIWHYPSQNECLTCHNPKAGGSLSFNTRQLHRDRTTAAGSTESQLAAWKAAGYFSNPPEVLRTLPRYSEPDSPMAGPRSPTSLEWQVRRYLDVNCAFCHQPGGLGGGLWDARITTPTDAAGLVDGVVLNSTGVSGARVIAPGDVGRSVLLHRMSRKDALRMPPLGSNETDPVGAALLTQWIQALSSKVSFSDWLSKHTGIPYPSEPPRDNDSDGDGNSDYLEFLGNTDPTLAANRWRPLWETGSAGPHLRLRRPANVSLRLEGSASLDSPEWRPVDAPGNEPGFLNHELSLDIALPTNAAVQFYRVVWTTP